MNEPSSNKPVPLLALAAGLIIPALLPHSAHGMYDPKHGRWLQRDPLGYVDGMNLYVYLQSNPNWGTDPFGQWGEEVHTRRTISWAKSMSMQETAAVEVGAQNAATDRVAVFGWQKYSGQSWVPIGKGQDYHFNGNKASEEDSRRVHQREDIAHALDVCMKHDDPVEAARWVGHGLHALGDWWAHGDWSAGKKDFAHHGDRDAPNHSFEGYDDPDKDADGPVYFVDSEPHLTMPSQAPRYIALWGPYEMAPTPVNALANGRPAKVYGMGRFMRNGFAYQVFWEARWPKWKAGTQRVKGTEKESKEEIDGFLKKICSECNNGKCPKCQCYFIKFGPPCNKFCWR